MGRHWNQVKSALYTRIPWLTEAYIRLKGKRWEDAIPSPGLAKPGRPLAEAKVGLLTSAGVHLHTQEPFDMINPEGDATYRVIPEDVAVTDLRITHDYYDHGAADRDVNCVFPLERLREMAREGILGATAPRHVGFMGHILGSERGKLVARSAGEIAELFAADGVDIVLASPG
ncbi:MAG: glycine/sarcosine/betaine reductase selenoprotein B family protein [Gemmatimonadales bacterium]